MKERNKSVEAYSSNDMDCYYSTSELVPCKKHPSSSSGGGICAYCLKDRLVKLVCSDCGEQRLSSCSCSDEMISSHRNSSCTTVEVGSVGRVSFLIENEKNHQHETTPVVLNQHQHLNPNKDEEEEVVVLRRSSSNCVEIKRNGLWRIGKFFRKKKQKEKEKERERDHYCGRSVGGFDIEKSSEMWMMMDNNHAHGGVSRSRSLCSFRGGNGVFGSEDGGDSVLSGARSSISAARSSGVNGGLMLESGRRSGYSEAEPRRSGFEMYESENNGNGNNGNDLKGGGRKSDFDHGGFQRRVFSLRESDFKGMDESSFIDLKLDYSSSESKMGGGNLVDTLSAFGSIRGGGGNSFMAHDGGGGGLVGDHGVLTSGGGGGSCRITVNDRGIKRGRKSSNKGWRWIFRYHSNWGGTTTTARKRDENHLMFKT